MLIRFVLTCAMLICGLTEGCFREINRAIIRDVSFFMAIALGVILYRRYVPSRLCPNSQVTYVPNIVDDMSQKQDAK